MLTKEMTLLEMLNFKPSEMDMISMPLEATTYIKVSIVSLYKEINYDFIRYLFSIDGIQNEFKDLSSTTIYDFDGSSTKQARFVSIFELYSLYSYANVSDYLKENLEKYDHNADVIIDIYTHDSHAYRLSNLDGIVKLEEMKLQ